jgi:hypothetical protein
MLIENGIQDSKIGQLYDYITYIIHVILIKNRKRSRQWY